MRFIGDLAAIADPNKPVAVRVHDECNGSDVFGSDICTCRPSILPSCFASKITPKVPLVSIPKPNAAIFAARSSKIASYPGLLCIQVRTCRQLFALVTEGKSRYFTCDLTKLTKVADYVIEVIRCEYPDLEIPFHSRWRHFEVGDVPRLAQLDSQLAGLTPLEKAAAKFDLAIVSVLLDFQTSS